MKIVHEWDHEYFLDIVCAFLEVERQTILNSFVHTAIVWDKEIEEMTSNPSSLNKALYRSREKLSRIGITVKGGCYSVFLTKEEWNYGILLSSDPLKIAMSNGSNNPYSLQLLSDVFVSKSEIAMPFYCVLKVKKFVCLSDLITRDDYTLSDMIEKMRSTINKLLDYVKYNLRIDSSSVEFYELIIQRVDKELYSERIYSNAEAMILEYLKKMLHDVVQTFDIFSSFDWIRFDLNSDFAERNLVKDENGNILPYDAINFFGEA